MPTQLLSLDYAVPSCESRLAEFPVRIGHAADAHIRLMDQSVSDHHCEIDEVNGSMIVRDLDSVHGTFINGMRIHESELRAGDRLSVGMLTFLVQSVDETQTDRPQILSRGERQQRHEQHVAVTV